MNNLRTSFCCLTILDQNDMLTYPELYFEEALIILKAH